MKELLVTIGLIILGALITSTFVLNDTDSLKSAAGELSTTGINAIENVDWDTTY